MKTRKIHLFFAASFLLFVTVLEFSNSSSQDKFSIISLPSPTPIPFRELTIPYLREREYKSKLGKLEVFSENQSYTSYVTSYTSDGLKIYGLLTVPQGDPSTSSQDNNRKYPVIIFIHGYIPPTQYQTSTQYADYVDYLARNGFVVFKIDLRGHGNSEGEPGGAYYSSDYVIDVLNAYSALQNSDFVNPQKIGLWGHSMAGNVISRSLAANPNIKASVMWAGAVYSYSDLQEYGINDNSYQPPQISSERVRKRQQLFDTHGQFDEKSSFWQQIPATNYLQDFKGKIQLHHAVNDDVVSIEYSRNLKNLFEDSVELNEYPSGGHNINGASFNQAMQKTVNFFKENLN